MNRDAALECLLFVSAEPLDMAEAARAMACTLPEAEQALFELQLRLEHTGSGLQVVRIAGGVQLSTKPEHAEIVGQLMAGAPTKLSRAALETVAIVAYQQPVTQPEIEAVRGVSTGGVLKTLLERRLIAEAGRKQALGRPILYVTTPEFLHYFALRDLAELPKIDADPPVDDAAPSIERADTEETEDAPA